MLTADPAAKKKKQRTGEGGGEETKAECTQCAGAPSHFVLTLRLSLFFFLSLSLWKWRRGGKFMALQLLSLVTVNWLLSEAVRVFYGRPFVPGLCLGSHLWGERSYRRPRRRTLLPLTLQPRDYCRWHVSILSANPSPPPPDPLSVCPPWSLQGQTRLLLCPALAWESCSFYL